MTSPYVTSAGPFDATVATSTAARNTNAWQLHGRIGRARYFLFSLLYMVLAGLVLWALFRMWPDWMREHVGTVTWILNSATGCVLARRRLHDLGHSGWLSALTLLPLISLFVYVWLLLAPGSAEHNRFGPPPAPNPRGAVAGLWALFVVVTFALMTAVIVPAVQAYNAKARITTV